MRALLFIIAGAVILGSMSRGGASTPTATPTRSTERLWPEANMATRTVAFTGRTTNLSLSQQAQNFYSFTNKAGGSSKVWF